MRVALFGGSFNPPHVAHQLVALYVIETAPVDELWFVPTFLHPFDKPLEPFGDRFHMCELAAAALGPRVRVSDIEAQMGGKSRTLRTVRGLMSQHPALAFSLVIGSDLVTETESWYGGDELRRLIPFIVVGRGSSPHTDFRGHRNAHTAVLDEFSGDVPVEVGGRAPKSPDAVSAAETPPGPHLPPVMPAVSSTEVRAVLGAGGNASALVPKSVLDYITSRGLYRSPRTS